jgi:ketosteroid isomerase-like protein
VSNADRLAAAFGPIFGSDSTDVDLDVIDRLIAAASPLTSDDATIVMTAGDQFQATYEGPDGMRAAWVDWLDAFSRLRFEIDRYEQIGDNVVTLGKQVGTSRRGGVEIEQPSAAVWKFRDEKIVRVEFHLSHEAALESARRPD